MHAKLSPSSAARWINCPGSVSLCDGLESLPTSIYALEGSIAHALAEFILSEVKKEIEKLDNKLKRKLKFKIIRSQHEKGKRLLDVIEKVGKIKINDEMLLYVRGYVNTILAYTTASNLEGPFIEKRVNFGGTYGTCDCMFINRETLYIFDLKYGKKKVKAKENLQLVIYGLGALNFFELSSPKFISLNIYQPRVKNPLNGWTLPVNEFKKTWGKKIIKAIKNTKTKTDIFQSGDYCYFCPAWKICPIVKEKQQQVAKEEFTNG